ncbi:hypothetical protein HPB48_020698 [Haemaphysalis longicornis]|uniref:UPF3 domain-containing protein n=1 Tax=Haemaphysalis longicornis TaxID=44386 RepID=A0A9J6G739_HAELO|nr:hypothetical protein HPB48_020698 [Haemaphysalis longicornis]
MTEEQFLEQISPVPANDYMYFVKGNKSLGPHAFSRAYINFVNQDEIFIFKEKFDDYIFVDEKGNEYPAMVEYAPFQKIPKRRSRKRDPKCGTIEQDPEYLKFLESLEQPEEVSLPSIDTYIEEIEAREKEMKANNGCLKVVTPLIEYLQQRKMERLAAQKLRRSAGRSGRGGRWRRKRLRDEEKRRRKVDRERSKESGGHIPRSAKSKVGPVRRPGTRSAVAFAAGPVLKNPVRDHHDAPASSKDVGGGGDRGGGGVLPKSGVHPKAVAAGARTAGSSSRKDWEPRPPRVPRPPTKEYPPPKEYQSTKHSSSTKGQEQAPPPPAASTHRRGSGGGSASDGKGGNQETSSPPKASTTVAADDEGPPAENSRSSGGGNASSSTEGSKHAAPAEKDRERPLAPEESSQSRQKDPRAERRIRNKVRGQGDNHI